MLVKFAPYKKLCSATTRASAQMIWYVKKVRMRTRFTVKFQSKKILCFLSKSQRTLKHLERNDAEYGQIRKAS